MRCPTCKSDTKVLETRYMEENNSMKRRRECLNCGKRFTTYEKLEDSVLMVQKKSGRMELFDKAKILNGVAKACEKYGVRVQNSVFEMVIEPVMLVELVSKIKKVIDLEKDSVRIYHLGNKWENKIDIIGRQPTFKQEDSLIF